MAEQDEDFGKKCTHTKVHLNRSKRYYRNGHYFLNKNAYQAWMKKKLEDQAQPAE